MNVEQWKKIKDVEIEEEIQYRELVGLKTGEGQRTFYPESLVQFVKKLFPEAIITDIFFRFTGDDSYSVELLRFEATIGNDLLALSLYLEIEEDNIYLQFFPLFNGIREITDTDLQNSISLLYQEMNEFMETYSTKRLFLLSSNGKKTLPGWMVDTHVTKCK